MKKMKRKIKGFLIIIGIAITVAFVLSSCDKQHSCECETTVTKCYGESYYKACFDWNKSDSTYFYGKIKQKDAKNKCKTYSSTVEEIDSANVKITYNYSTSCELK